MGLIWPKTKSDGISLSKIVFRQFLKFHQRSLQKVKSHVGPVFELVGIGDPRSLEKSSIKSSQGLQFRTRLFENFTETTENDSLQTSGIAKVKKGPGQNQRLWFLDRNVIMKLVENKLLEKKNNFKYRFTMCIVNINIFTIF